MVKNILFLIVFSIIFSACTVIVSDPQPRYVVAEIGYTGSRPVEVYYSGGYYYYAPCAGVPPSYYHTRVSYYNRSHMRVVTYHRPQTVIIKEAAPVRTNTVIIKEEPRRNNTVIIKEEPRRNNTVVIKEEPSRSNTTVIKETTPRKTPAATFPGKTHNGPQDNKTKDNTVIIKK